ncbi:MAG TPA: phospho-N-acetylmuramoyl-pentapeptide-transferase [Candidatus Saccharimonadia bacterium]|nr:phospho-N-acetylmuramoyl-pentapeptide-transferase [Candidatus Saccharimonadia bacterium]
MALILGLLLFSFILTSVLIVPFINGLYKLKFQRRDQKTTDMFGKLTPIFDKFHGHKVGTPVGGGLLMLFVVALVFAITFPLLSAMGISITQVYPVSKELNVIFFTFLSFGVLGLYDDIKKFFGFGKQGFFGLRIWQKLGLQCILGAIVALMLYFSLGISIVNVPFFGVVQLNWAFIPFAMLVVVGFANAVNITDGLDGLAGGVLLICLFGLWFLSAAILDTTLSIFLALWIGALIAFLYFNIFPARIWMGDVGSLAFGATLAVVGLLLGKVMALLIIGGIFVVEVGSSFLQIMSKRLRGKKLFPASPVHLWLQYRGWQEPKIVQRAVLTGIILTMFGVWLAVI